MAGKKGLGALLGNFIEVTPEAPKPQAQPTTPPPSAGVARPATQVDSLTDLLGSATSMAPKRAKSVVTPSPPEQSERIAKLLKAVQDKIPQDNALMLLRQAEEPLKSAIPDATARRAAALGVLKNTQGMTSEAFAAGEQEVAQIIDSYFANLSEQARQMRATSLPTERAQAEKLRAQATDIDAQIEELNTRKRALLDEAQRIEQDVSTQETELAALEQELETARAAAHAHLCPSLS